MDEQASTRPIAFDAVRGSCKAIIPTKAGNKGPSAKIGETTETGALARAVK